MYIRLDLPAVALAIATAIVIGLASTLIPAYRASHLNVAEALRFSG
jgi:ABC-type lipoprotein release transport system permease subunit